MQKLTDFLQAKNLHDLMLDVISEAKLSKLLNNAACNFIKHPGHVYHLYERPSGQKYLSMLSPEVIIVHIFYFEYLNLSFRNGKIHHTNLLVVTFWKQIYLGEMLNKKMINMKELIF